MTEVTARARRQAAAPSVFRRALLMGACASAATLAFTSASRSGAPFGISPAFGETPAAGGYDAFIVLSRHLTGRAAFDQVLGRRIHAALSATDRQFARNVDELNRWIQSHGGVPSDVITQALQASQPALVPTVTAVMRAWYLGIVGALPTAQVLAYERALMFDPVKDVLTIPSYCRDVPFYWAHRPTS